MPSSSPFATPERAARYDTSRYQGATGLNWYDIDSTLQRTVRYHLRPHELEWAEPRLRRIGELMGGPISERAAEIDRDPPRLERYDRWGHDVGDVWYPEAQRASKRDVLAARFSSAGTKEDARRNNVRLEIPAAVFSYLLDQADIGLACAIGTGGDMVAGLVAKYGSPELKEFVLPRLLAGDWEGETAQMLTERAGGSDLGQMETTATPNVDHHLLNGVKWFASNPSGQVFIVMAKSVGAPDSGKGVSSFLVMRERRDGSPNGVHLRRLKDKLGTKSVASAEVEFIDAEAFLLASEPGAASTPGGGQGLTRIMQMTNASRIGVSLMGLGCARRALVESLCYARAREAFGKKLIDHPLMRRKLAEMIVDVEAVQAMVFDAHGQPNRQRRVETGEKLRLAPAVVKLKAARLGITAASDAIEVHGGNGYVENWPVARILRDAQVNTIWEGTDNILCLDVRRAIEREAADVPFLDRLREATENAAGIGPAEMVRERVEDLANAIAAWKRLDRETGEARLFPLARFIGDVYAAALLAEQAAWELTEFGDRRKELVATAFAERALAESGPLRGIDAPPDAAIEHFDELIAGAFAG